MVATGWRKAVVPAALVWASGLGTALAYTEVSLHGMLGDKALVSFGGGQPRVMRMGESIQGVTLTAIGNGRITLEEAGKRREVALGATGGGTGGVSGSAGEGRSGTTLITADGHGQFLVYGQVEGATVRFLVDTGASQVALPMSVARNAGLQLDKTQPVGISTANGLTRGYRAKINRIRVGEITLYQVDALVLEDASLNEPLLGMSFLNRTLMKRDGDQMTLKVRY